MTDVLQTKVGFSEVYETGFWGDLFVHTNTQGTYKLGRFIAHASILCTVMEADQNKESFPYPGVESTCLFYCSSQKSEYTVRVNEITLGAANTQEV